MSDHKHAENSTLLRLKVRNMLSFGPDGLDIDLAKLTVLIGPNGSGKSNLFEAIGLLQAAPRLLATPVREGGGIRGWIWMGHPGSTAIIEATIDSPRATQPLRHRIDFTETSQMFSLVDEVVDTDEYNGASFTYRYRWGLDGPRLAIGNQEPRELRKGSVSQDESILSQFKDPDRFPELDDLRMFYEGIRLYREWTFGRSTIFRQPQRSDVRPLPLDEDFSNLGMFLSQLRMDPKTKTSLIDKLSDAYEGLTDFELNFEGGTVQVFFTEGELAVPATRLSDGSLRYLCLLAILLDPDPPPLVGIEEPEMGMHPDLIPKLADLLVDASQRCQLIVTTHSDILVDALSDNPDAVVVCQKHDGQTSMRRLDSSDLSQWLEKYRLGELWTSGELGGVRW